MWYQMLVYYFQKEFETKFLDGPYYPKRKIYIWEIDGPYYPRHDGYVNGEIFQH